MRTHLYNSRPLPGIGVRGVRGSLLAVASCLATSIAANAQMTGQYTYDSANHAFFITGSTTYDGFPTGDGRVYSDFFVGKDNATGFNTIPGFLDFAIYGTAHSGDPNYDG